MSQPRGWLGLALSLWVLFLALPAGRANLEVTTLHPDLGFPVSDKFWDIKYQHFPDPAFILHAYPNDRNADLAFFNNIPPDQQPATVARFPRDPAILAAYLTGSWIIGPSHEFDRDDDPVSNPFWPGPYMGYWAPALSQSEVSMWRQYLEIAKAGAALEPNNTFFVWKELAALLALHRDEEAFAVLNSSATKTGFDEHFSDRLLARDQCYERIRPLTPTEEEWLIASNMPMQDEAQFRRIGRCLVGQVILMRARGQDQRALTTAGNFFHLGEIYQKKAYNISGWLTGMACEDITVNCVYLAPMSAQGRLMHGVRYWQKLDLTSTHNLAGYAMALHRPDLASQILAERTQSARDMQTITRIVDQGPFLPASRSAFLEGMEERWARLLLTGLPLCVLLYLVSFLSMKSVVSNDAAPFSIADGVRSGILVFLGLAALDAVVAAQGANKIGVLNLPYFAEAPGLYDLSTLFVFLAPGGAFAGISFARARRWQRRNLPKASWRDQAGPALRSPVRNWAEILRMTARLTVTATFWFGAIGAFGYLCLEAYSAPSPSLELVSNEGNYFGLGFLTCLLISATYRWSKLPDRIPALKMMLFHLRRLTGGYLVAALILYPASALLIIPVEGHFKKEFRTYLEQGETMAIRGALGN